MATGINLAQFTFAGTAQLDEVFGYFQAAGPVQINRLILVAQVGAVGGNIVVALIDGDGEELGRITMASATSYQASNLASLITLARGDVVRAKFVEIDAGVAQYFTLSVIGATAEYPSGPCCCGPCAPVCGAGWGYWGGGCC